MNTKVKITSAANAWAHLTLAAVIAAEASFIFLGIRFLMPACRRLVLLSGMAPTDAYGFMPGGMLLSGLLSLAKDKLPWLVIAFAVGWIVVEWIMRAENRRALRISMMTSVSLVLFGVAVALATLTIVPIVNAGQRMSSRYPEPVVSSQMAALDRFMTQLDDAVAKQDWAAVHLISHEGGGAAQNLVLTGDAASALLTVNMETKIRDIRIHLGSVQSFMLEVWAASRRAGEGDRIETAMRGLHTAYGDLREDMSQGAK
jgi:hypothetical protein